MNKLFNNKIMMFIMILLFFKPICFQYYSSLEWLENIFVYGKIAVAFLILLDTFLGMMPKVKINKFLIKIFLFEAWIFVVTLFNQGAIFRSFIDLVSTLVIAMMIIKLFKLNPKELLKTFKNVLFVLICLQLASEIIWPTGMPADLYENNATNPLYFMTIDNGITNLICLCIALIFINNDFNNLEDKNNKIKSTISVSICLLTAVLSHSSTGIICTILLIIFLGLSRIKQLKITEKGWLLFGIYAIVSLLLFTENSIFEKIMELITGKNNFTGRSLLWSRAIEMIGESPIFGYGVISGGYIKAWLGFFSSHNMILEMLLQGGIIALLLWLLIMGSSLTSLKKIENYKIKRTLTVLLFVILIALTMEATVHSIYLFSTFALIYVFANAHDSEHKKTSEEENEKVSKRHSTNL